MLLQSDADSRHGGQSMAGEYFSGVLIEPDRFCYATFELEGVQHDVVVFTDSLGHHGRRVYFYYDGILRDDADHNRGAKLDPPPRPHQAGIGIVDPVIAPTWMYARNQFGQYDITFGDLVVAIGNRLNAVHTPAGTIALNRTNPYDDHIRIVFAQDWSSVTVEARGAAARQ